MTGITLAVIIWMLSSIYTAAVLLPLYFRISGTRFHIRCPEDKVFILFVMVDGCVSAAIVSGFILYNIIKKSETK